MATQNWENTKSRFSVSDIITKLNGQAYLSKFYFEIEPGPGSFLNNIIGSNIKLNESFFYSQGITIPSRGINTDTYTYSNGFKVEIPTGTNYGDGNINIPLICDNSYTLYRFFINWMDLIHSKQTGFFTFHDDYTTNLFVKQLDYTAGNDSSLGDANAFTNNINSFHDNMSVKSKENCIYCIELTGCYPKAVSAIEFRHDSKERVEFNVNLSYEGINYIES